VASFMDDYEPVEDRIRAFWNDHPAGAITTELVSDDGQGGYVVKASVYTVADGLLPTTGYAHDSAAQLPANMKASALEVCETSAIGRALANLGYAPKGRRPSREEMSKKSPAGETPKRVSKSSRSQGPAEGETPSLAIVPPAGDTPPPPDDGVASEGVSGGSPGEEAPPDPSTPTEAKLLYEAYVGLCKEAGLKPVSTFVQVTNSPASWRQLQAGEVPVADIEKAIAHVAEVLLRKVD